jgi:hypothetical protein
MDKITEKLFPITKYISEKLTKNHDLAFDFNKLDLGHKKN